VTADDLSAALPTYAAGVEAELSLLEQLRQIALQQHEASRAQHLAEVNKAGDARERLMAALVRLEHELKPIRLAIAAHSREAATLEGFAAVRALHQTAAALVTTVLQADQDTLAELQSAEAARRTSAQSVETGAATLAAYRRVLTPSIGSTGLINRRG
jgi:hypothetical protein